MATGRPLVSLVCGAALLQALIAGPPPASAAPKSKCYGRMAALIADNHLPDPNIPKTVLMCIFWEETAFRNMLEARKIDPRDARAKPLGRGFGQVTQLLSGYREVLDQSATAGGPVKRGFDFSFDGVLRDDAFSVQVASAVAKIAWRDSERYAKKGDAADHLRKALSLYASGRATVITEHVRPWMRCAKKLEEAEAFAILNPDQGAVIAALRLAHPASHVAPPDPSVVFDADRCSMN